MKTLPIFLFVLGVTTTALSQNLRHFEVSEESGLITFERVIITDNIPAYDLQKKAKEWIGQSEINGSITSETETSINGRYRRNYKIGVGMNFPFDQNYRIQVKDGALRFVIDRIVNAQERTFGDPYTAEKYFLAKDGSIKPRGQAQLLNDIITNCERLGNSLEKYVKAETSDNW